MDIRGKKVHSAAFGAGVVTEQAESTVTISFDNVVKKFLYPSGFDTHLVAEDPEIQKRIHAEITSEKDEMARQLRTEKRRAIIQAEQRKAEARKKGRKK